MTGTDYARAIIEGMIPAGQLIHKAAQRHLADLDAAEERGLHFDQSAADKAVRFISLLSHSKGEWAGQPFNPSPWQLFIIESLFGWKRADGLRRFRTAYIEIPRKNGKSTLAAAIALYLAFGDGEPGAEVYSAATTQKQARIVFDEAKRMARKNKYLAKHVKIWAHSISRESSAQKFEPVSSEAGTLDGLNPHGVIIDELHAHKSRDVYDVLETALGARRNPLLLSITTAGNNQTSICWEIHQHGEKVLNGVIPDDSFFAFIASIDESDNWQEPECWPKAIPNLNISVKVQYLKDQLTKAIHTPASQNNFLRKYLDVWTSRESDWLNMDDWNKCNKPVELEELKGKRCYAGLDLASTKDLTALVLYFPESHSVLPFFWTPEGSIDKRKRTDNVPYDAWVRDGFMYATDGNVIDYEAVRAKLNELADVYDISEVGFDPHNSSQIVTNLMQDGFTMVEVRQGMLTLSPPTKELERLVLKGDLRHGGHPILTWCASNVIVESDAADNIKPNRKRSKEKIDGIIALIIALSRSILDREDERPEYLSSGMLSVSL
jgi:phage terminase large subunit-like protein